MQQTNNLTPVSRRHSLEAKLATLTIALIFAILLGVGHLSLKQQRNALLEEKQQGFQTLGKVISATMQPGLAMDEHESYTRIVKQLQNNNADLEFVVIADPTGKTLFAQSRRKPTNASSTNILGTSARRVLTIVSNIAGIDYDSLYESRFPLRLGDGRYVNVSFGFSLHGINEKLDAMRQALFGWFAVALIIGVLAAVMLARGVTHQIRLLSQAAQAVTAGNLSTQVDLVASDESGELARIFNQMVVQLKADQEKLEKRANTDSLTGLYNHRFFQERLAQEIKRAERHGRELSVVMMDIDHFKQFNDTQGHPAGDGALRDTAGILQQIVRDIDVVGRYGGEEFAVILTECSLEDSVEIAERLRQAVEHHRFVGKSGDPSPLSCSIGISHFPLHSQEREGLILAADVALYQSKSLGRNQVRCYDGSSAEESQDAPSRFCVALHATDIATVESLAEAIDARQNRKGYSKSVAKLAVALGIELGMDGEDIESLRIACLLRDIGQIGIPDSIIMKQEQLTTEERKIIESHPALGYAIVERSSHFKAMLPGILHHHERWDGSGYPNGLEKDRIPLVARIVAIADAYLAMTHPRPYRAQLTKEAAFLEIEHCAGTQFDPDLAETFLRLHNRQSKAA